MGLIPKTICLVEKDLIFMARNSGWTSIYFHIPILFILASTIYIISNDRAGEPVKDRFWINQINETIKFPGLSMFNKTDKCYQFENYLDGELVQWDNMTKTMMTTGTRNTPEDLINKAEEFIVNSDGHKDCYDVLLHGYFMSDKTKEVTLVRSNTFPSSFMYHYRIMMMNFGTEENTTRLHIDGLHIQPPIEVVPDSNQKFTAKFFFAYSCVLLLPLMGSVIHLSNEKKVIQPYFEAIGLQSWFFHFVHFLNGVIRISIMLIVFVGAMLILDINTNYSIFILCTFIFTCGATSFALLIGTIIENGIYASATFIFLWLFSLIYAKDLQHVPLLLNINICFAYDRFIKILTPSVKSAYGLCWFQTDVEAQYPLIVYICFMIFDTIWMTFLALFWDDISKFLSNLKAKLRYGSVNEDYTADKLDEDGSGYMDKTVLGCQDLPMRKDLKVGIELKNAAKVYSNGYRALNGVTMRAMNGQVTCLLGANGAGKSTIFSMITNIIKPSHGTVKVYNNKENTDGGKSLIGYCPQYNPLMDQLTVLEHLKLIDVLKGTNTCCFKSTFDSDSPCKNFDEESMELLTLVGLHEKRDEMAGQLSGGMKRKLCVCMAMIGGSQIVLLDEPTAGIDTAARRDVQKILTKCKKDRTILLTTHFMDEAEAVADWVLVLTDGKLAAAGTSSYLKKTYFDGFLTNVVVSDKHPIETSIQNMKSLFEHYIPGSSLMFQRGFQLEMYVPNTAKEAFADFLVLLEDIMSENFSNPKFASLQSTTGTDMSTYSVVTFGLSETTLVQVLSVICKKIDEMDQNRDAKKIDMMEANYKALVDAKNDEPQPGVCTVIKQLYSLFVKRLIYTFSTPFDILTVILPCLFIAGMAIRMSHLDDIIPNSLANIGNGIAIVQFSGTENKQILDYLGKYSNLDVKIEPFSTEMSEFVLHYRDELFFILHVHDNHNVIHYNSKRNNSADIMSDFLGNMMYLRSASNPRIEDYIVTIKEINTKEVDEKKHIVSLIGVFFAFFIIFETTLEYIVCERIFQFDLLQKLTGVSFWIVYVAQLIYGFIAYAIVISVAYLCFWWCGLFAHQFLLLAPLFLLFFLNMNVYANIFSKFSQAPDLCVMYFWIFTFLPVVLITAPETLLWILKRHHLYWISPAMYFIRGLGKLLFSPVENPRRYKVAREEYFQFDELWGEGGLYVDLIGMTVQYIVFLSLWYAMNSQKVRVWWHNKWNEPVSVVPSTNPLTNNNALRKEQELIEENYGQPSGCAVVVDKLVQLYGEARALNGISFTVKASECFGLLGVNGAGKTTTFDILTGRRLPRGGDATIDCVSVMDKVTIGFCPQVDALMDHLTGRQCFYLFARLHRYNDEDEVVRVLLECIEMTEHCNKQLRRLSGGQRRRISVGVAILSRSHCMILDEPTTGIDPIARRELWNVLNNVRQSAGTSIILTSHSMDECQALCGRITILQKGEMVALGTSQEYMTEYGEFFTVVLTVSDQSQRDTVAQEALENLKDSELATTNFEFDQNIYIKWKKTANDKWSEKFATVAKVAQQLKCNDFMLTQATLEDAVVKLTGGQTEQSKESVNNDKEKGETVQSKENPIKSKEETKTDATATKSSLSQAQIAGVCVGAQLA